MNKKSRLKAGLIFGIAMAIFFILQSLLTQDNLTVKNIFKSIALGIFSGAVSGLLFGWIIGLFAKSKLITQATKINLEADETILFETPANHFKGIEAVGGKLYYTNKRLVFKSHKFNIQNHQISVNLNNINNIVKYKTLGLVNNGLSINTKQNTTEKFVVEQVDEWVQQIAEKNF